MFVDNPDKDPGAEPLPEDLFDGVIGHPDRVIGAMADEEDGLACVLVDQGRQVIGQIMIILRGGEEGKGDMARGSATCRHWLAATR